ncbi:hypothetical protein G6F58_013762 [Rhizopus delemar]|nr:hypothetical protein G6F58_013762 [Rhizopus delemar]
MGFTCAIDLRQRNGAVEQRLQAIVVAAHHHRGTGRLALCGHQLQEGCGGIPVQRRGRFIGQQHRRPANQRTSGRHALLLADTQGGREIVRGWGRVRE